MINIVAGNNNLPKIILHHSSGATAEVYLHGAQVTSWVTATGDELLFLSHAAEFTTKAIRGGIPLCWPQFGGQGSLPAHGFVRTADWEFASSDSLADGAITATLRLTETPASLALWPHKFLLKLAVTLRETTLTVAFHATNTGSEEFTSQLAFHTYFHIEDIHRAAVSGLHGTTYQDAMHDMTPTPEQNESIRFTEETDRIYLNTPSTLQVIDKVSKRTISIEKTNLPDAVVWNPWSAKAQRMPDFGDTEYQQMLCVETARISEPLTLAPGTQWTAETVFRCE